MRVMVMVKATESSEVGEMPGEQLMAGMGRFNEELAQAGLMKAGEGLKPSSEGVRVRFSGANRSVTDGPFAETKELVAGFWLWEVKSLDEAVQWVKRCPNPMMEDSDVEIRPLYELEDLSQNDPTGEWSSHEEGLRNTIVTQNSFLQPYLFFSGRCEEALEFYSQAIGAQVGMTMRFSDSPEPHPEGTLQPGFENKIMHAEFTVGDIKIMASDGCIDMTTFSGFRLVLQVPTAADADRVFHALADGGTVDMPLAKMFWSPRYGQVTDRFGVGWMVMVPSQTQ